MPWGYLLAGILDEEDTVIERLGLALLLDLDLRPVDGAASERPPRRRRQRRGGGGPPEETQPGAAAAQGPPLERARRPGEQAAGGGGGGCRDDSDGRHGPSEALCFPAADGGRRRRTEIGRAHV